MCVTHKRWWWARRTFHAHIAFNVCCHFYLQQNHTHKHFLSNNSMNAPSFFTFKCSLCVTTNDTKLFFLSLQQKQNYSLAKRLKQTILDRNTLIFSFLEEKIANKIDLLLIFNQIKTHYNNKKHSIVLIKKLFQFDLLLEKRWARVEKKSKKFLQKTKSKSVHKQQNRFVNNNRCD